MARRGDDDDELNDPVLGFMRLMWQLDHELHRASKRMKATIGLTGPQRLALLFVGRRPGVSAGELAGFLHLHPGTLTGIINRLEHSGFVTREWAAEDARRMQLTLTEKGRAANRRRGGTVEAAVRRTLADLPPTSRAAAEQVLATLASQLSRGREQTGVDAYTRSARKQRAVRYSP